MKIFITGANGAIGQKLLNKFRDSQYDVTILRRRVVRDASAKVILGDLLDPDILDKATKDIDAVVHLAGVTHAANEGLYFKVNTTGTKYLVEACKRNNVKRFIYVSSRAAGVNSGAYGKSKLMAEEVVEKSGLDWVILRPAEVYGAGDNEAISKLINIIRKYKFVPIIGNGEYKLAPVYVEDITNAIYSSLKTNNTKKIYILAGPEELTYDQVIDKICSKLDIKVIKLHIPVQFFKLAATISGIFGGNLVPDQIPRLISEKSSDISQAKKYLKFNPISFDKGLKFAYLM